MTLILEAVPVMLGGGGGLLEPKELAMFLIRSVLSPDTIVSLDDASLTIALSGSIRVIFVLFVGILKIGFSTPLVPTDEMFEFIVVSDKTPTLLFFIDVNDEVLRRAIELSML
jgi:hypothetical protein